MDNQSTTRPALLTQPAALQADRGSEQGKAVHTVIFLIALTVLAGIVYLI